MTRVSGSFRDPYSNVCEVDGRIFRIIKPAAQPDYHFVKGTQFFKSAQETGQFIPCDEMASSKVPGASDDDLVIEHPRLDFISYPYEWSFEALKRAALLHLDLQIAALKEDVIFSDASAYNVQFQLGAPIFIDATSLKRYKEGEPWLAHKQFCESFLAPLVLQAKKNIPFQPWYRGSVEGIPIADLAHMMRWKDYVSPVILSHIILPAMVEKQDSEKLANQAKQSIKKGISKNGYNAILHQLRRFVESLHIKSKEKSTWGDYSTHNSYLPKETEDKVNVIKNIVTEHQPHTVVDIGCNDGLFSTTALDAGAKLAIGFDFDHPSLNRAFTRANKENLNFLPLYMDLANPSPGQGFAGTERPNLSQRLGKADLVLALAVVHHLAIGKNIPLERAIEYIASLGKSALIEFVPKNDDMVQRMLAIREDVFGDYTRDMFVTAIEKHMKIESNKTLTASGREIFHVTTLAA